MATRLKKLGLTAAAGTLIIGMAAGFEGFRTKAYLDPVGIPTICYGETKGVRLGQIKTKTECDDLLMSSLVEHEQRMRKCMVDPDGIPIESYIAFLDFTYNVGSGAFCKSTLAKKLNQGDLLGACNELPKWNKAGGKVLKGLTTRREAEKTLCLKGV